MSKGQVGIRGGAWGVGRGYPVGAYACAELATGRAYIYNRALAVANFLLFSLPFLRFVKIVYQSGFCWLSTQISLGLFSTFLWTTPSLHFLVSVLTLGNCKSPSEKYQHVRVLEAPCQKALWVSVLPFLSLCLQAALNTWFTGARVVMLWDLAEYSRVPYEAAGWISLKSILLEITRVHGFLPSTLWPAAPHSYQTSLEPLH